MLYFYLTIHAVLASYLQCHFLCFFQGFSVRSVELKRESSSVYVTLGFAGIAMGAAIASPANKKIMYKEPYSLINLI